MPWAALLTPGRTRAPTSATITRVPTNGVSRDAWPRDPGEQLPQPGGSEHHVRPGWTARTVSS